MILVALFITLSLLSLPDTLSASGPIVLQAASLGLDAIAGPAGSEDFGSQVRLLPNGNIVATDPHFDQGGTADVGAVYLYEGSTLALISTLKGSQGGDLVGSGGIVVLANGDFVVRSALWDNPSPSMADVGAITFCDATTGCDFVVSALNSVVGSAVNETVGNEAVTALTNGNYVVVNRFWDNSAPPVENAGAVRLCPGISAGCVGPFTAANSLTGTSDGDLVGDVTALVNGNYVVGSSSWDNSGPSQADAGAATLCDGTAGCAGVVITAANSLVGSTAGDLVGSGISALPNGNYVVTSQNWDNPSPATVDAGAVSWCNGTTGCTGAVSSANSIIGGSDNDGVGNSLTFLSNGDYLILSPGWDRPAPAVTDAGAVTFCTSAVGCSGVVAASNSLIGSTIDELGSVDIVELANGKHVVVATSWDDNNVQDVGAVRLCNAATGCTGSITTANSLVGTTPGDRAGSEGIVVLPNGNYIVATSGWDRSSPAAVDAGAVTFCSGASGCTGAISISNSLVGSSADDQVGNGSLEVLSNGNYVVAISQWDNPPAVDIGAVTWCPAVGGCIGAVSAANSLIGASDDDHVGFIEPLTNGNYVVGSPRWDRTGPLVQNAGAATWCNGSAPCTGVVSAANSLIGASENDNIGDGVYALANGNYVAASPEWDNPSPAAVDAGAVTWCDGSVGCTGTPDATNSLVGTSVEDLVGYTLVSALPNGNYIVASDQWDRVSPAVEDAGALTFCSGSEGCAGTVTAANSLVGASSGDAVGSEAGILPNGNYFAFSRDFDSVSPPVADAYAVTYGNARVGVVGEVTPANSVIGAVPGELGTMQFDPFRSRLIIQAQPSLRFFVYTPQDGYDVNCAGGIDAVDALAGLRTLAGFTDAPSAVAPCSGDVISDNDSELTLADVLSIRRRIAMLE